MTSVELGLTLVFCTTTVTIRLFRSFLFNQLNLCPRGSSLGMAPRALPRSLLPPAAAAERESSCLLLYCCCGVSVTKLLGAGWVSAMRSCKL